MEPRHDALVNELLICTSAAQADQLIAIASTLPPAARAVVAKRVEEGIFISMMANFPDAETRYLANRQAAEFSAVRQTMSRAEIRRIEENEDLESYIVVGKIVAFVSDVLAPQALNPFTRHYAMAQEQLDLSEHTPEKHIELAVDALFYHEAVVEGLARSHRVPVKKKGPVSFGRSGSWSV